MWATLAAIAACATLTFATPLPLPLKGALYALPLAAVLFASYSPWKALGIASATLGSAYAFIHYDALDMIFPQRSDRLLLGGAVALITYGMSFAARRVRRLQDDLADRVLHAEHALAVDLTAKNVELQNANAALTNANRALEAFTYVVSHDLKEPARALGQLTSALHEDHARALNDEGKELVKRSLDSSHRLQALLASLIEYSRATQIQPAQLRPLRIEDVVSHAECSTRYESLLRDRQGTIDVEAGPPVSASMVGLSQIVGNLVLNALKHNPRAGPRVHVRSEACMDDPRLVDVVFDDDGPGYPEALAEQFNQVGTARPTTLRGGFGLIIAREAAEKMGGRMRLDHAPGGGARTIVTLHAAASEAEVPLARPQAGLAAPPGP